MDDYYPSPMGYWPAPLEQSVGGRQYAIVISDNDEAVAISAIESVGLVADAGS